MQAFDPSTQEAESSGSLWVQDQPGVHSELQDSQGYAEKPCLKNQNRLFICYIKFNCFLYINLAYRSLAKNEIAFFYIELVTSKFDKFLTTLLCFFVLFGIFHVNNMIYKYWILFDLFHKCINKIYWVAPTAKEDVQIPHLDRAFSHSFVYMPTSTNGARDGDSTLLRLMDSSHWFL